MSGPDAREGPGHTRLTWGARGVAAAFAVSGVAHLVRPAAFDRLVPHSLPFRGQVIAVSGVAELVCAGGLVARRAWAARASALLLLMVWPGNWYLALRLQNSARASTWLRVLAWGRVPLQIPMICAVLRSGRPRRPAEPRAAA
ncbi:MAG TPA: DoxX family protein [Actinomycetes bacterium]|nr:DoxX family protein [Actinomycetes bacterium]